MTYPNGLIPYIQWSKAVFLVTFIILIGNFYNTQISFFGNFYNTFGDLHKRKSPKVLSLSPK